MAVSDDDTLRELLGMNRIAVVGCSSTPGKAAHEIPAYLQRQGYEIYPVNPFADEILGREAVDSLSEIENEIDLVDVFRPSEEVAGIVDETLDRTESTGDVEAIWLQLGIHDDAAVEKAEAAGLTVVEDRCMKVEHQRLME
ncbi:hypothetical protein halTADL_0014 [Halohasta litchfieldiae]|jgi:hypothetical protein|uniref:CoA-binding domain-containing protein n=1 Tax=Halohasta litchfieldiae TaxID=1073996 RepID=A0A1H6YC58_9EURY|nr:CoA-binding protein [Halohasta litchfieldiae]ATW86837.1 hypothetical protein halTADL_0014 [Halohasta litchfieldiae]SEJ36627.1 hypothetical protein SAMN05444271_1584 [Halohasta litchfieldiae]